MSYDFIFPSVKIHWRRTLIPPEETRGKRELSSSVGTAPGAKTKTLYVRQEEEKKNTQQEKIKCTSQSNDGLLLGQAVYVTRKYYVVFCTSLIKIRIFNVVIPSTIKTFVDLKSTTISTITILEE